jgi:three-Cys-motif partner protein
LASIRCYAYLDAWLPIISFGNTRILFIDGFAGPGEYVDGEDGSPQIAMRALVEHSGKIKAEVKYFFIEADKARAQHLKTIVEGWKSKVPATTTTTVIQSAFDNTMTQIFDYLDEKKTKLAPAFVMIDPFGVSGTPMSVVRRLLKYKKCEIYFSLMYEFLNRFKASPEFEPHPDAMFGCADWRELIEIDDTEKRRIALCDLYETQLRDAGAKHVIHFDIFDGNRLKYTIFFAIQHELGADRMKAAIWKAAPQGDFEFHGSKTPELTLITEPTFEPLKDQLSAKFGDGEWHSITKITNFVKSDKTDYHSGQLKSKTLKPMELAGRIEVDPATRQKAGTYPDGCRMKFKPLK